MPARIGGQDGSERTPFPPFLFREAMLRVIAKPTAGTTIHRSRGDRPSL
jgi:hypothetical protein